MCAIVGDGGFQMTFAELATAVTQKLPVKVIVINNRYLGMVRQWQNLFYDNRLSGVDLAGNPDFVKLAESYGCRAFRMRRTADVRPVLEKALAYYDGPCVDRRRGGEGGQRVPDDPGGGVARGHAPRAAAEGTARDERRTVRRGSTSSASTWRTTPG